MVARRLWRPEDGGPEPSLQAGTDSDLALPHYPGHPQGVHREQNLGPR